MRSLFVVLSFGVLASWLPAANTHSSELTSQPDNSVENYVYFGRDRERISEAGSLDVQSYR